MLVCICFMWVWVAIILSLQGQLKKIVKVTFFFHLKVIESKIRLFRTTIQVRDIVVSSLKIFTMQLRAKNNQGRLSE